MQINEERREVAARLRELAPGSDWPDMVAEACGLNPREMSNSFHEFTGELCERLADLIEPEPERTCIMHKEHEWNDEWEPYGIQCSECEEFVLGWKSEFGYAIPSYCPNCGAKVVE